VKDKFVECLHQFYSNAVGNLYTADELQLKFREKESDGPWILPSSLNQVSDPKKISSRLSVFFGFQKEIGRHIRFRMVVKKQMQRKLLSQSNPTKRFESPPLAKKTRKDEGQSNLFKVPGDAKMSEVYLLFKESSDGRRIIELSKLEQRATMRLINELQSFVGDFSFEEEKPEEIDLTASEILPSRPNKKAIGEEAEEMKLGHQSIPTSKSHKKRIASKSPPKSGKQKTLSKSPNEAKA
jgi:hypothetical protein